MWIFDVNHFFSFRHPNFQQLTEPAVDVFLGCDKAALRTPLCSIRLNEALDCDQGLGFNGSLLYK